VTILHYDLETTGFIEHRFPLHDPRQPRIVQIGAVLDDADRNEVMRLDVIIALKDEIPAKAAEIHGITTQMSQTLGVNETNAINTFLDMVDVADLIVGQNIIDFDNKVMTAVVRRLHKDPSADPFADKQFFDTMVAAKPICKIQAKSGGLKKPNLTEIHKHFFGEGFAKAHSAIADVLAARRCFYALQDLALPKGN
jgi:DNA polymerase III epsilon subunit-like protein